MNIKKGILYVFIANLINLLISLVTGFVLPKYLSVDSYANIKAFQLYITYIGILHLGYSDGMYLKYGGKNIQKINKKELKEEYNTFKIFQLIISILCVIVSLLLKNRIILYCSLVILPINIANYIRNLYQATGKFNEYSKYLNINTLMIFIINLIILFIIKSDDYNLYIIFYSIAYFLYWFFVEHEVNKIFGKVKGKYNRKYFIEDVKNGILLMLGNFANVIFTTVDRLFVKFILGTVKFAIYSFSVSIETLLTTLITPISTVMYNYLCNNLNVKNVVRVKKLIYIFSAVIIASVYPCMLIIQFFISKYNESINIMVLLFAAQYISVMIKTIHINVFKAEKKQKQYFIIMIIVILISIGLNVLMYYTFKDAISFAIATVITNAIWYVINEIALRKYKSDISDYIYFIAELIVFLLTTLKMNYWVGMAVYIVFTIFNTIIFERESVQYLFNEGKEVLNKYKYKISKAK